MTLFGGKGGVREVTQVEGRDPAVAARNDEAIVLEKTLEASGDEVSRQLGILVAAGLKDDVTFEGPHGSFTLRPRKPTVKIVRRGGERT